MPVFRKNKKLVTIFKTDNYVEIPVIFMIYFIVYFYPFNFLLKSHIRSVDYQYIIYINIYYQYTLSLLLEYEEHIGFLNEYNLISVSM